MRRYCELGGAANTSPDALQHQGRSLYDQSTGLPWVPVAFTLTAADGTQYLLDASGKVSRITFTDGAQWLVSDAGIAAVAATNANERVDFLRNIDGSIARITGPETPSPLAGEGRGEGAATVMRAN